MFPDQVQLALHVAGLGSDRHHGVLLRHHDHELPEGTVAAEGIMPAAPELVAIALQPVVLIVRTTGLCGQRLLDLEGRCLLHPLGGKQLPAMPDAFLQV